MTKEEFANMCELFNYGCYGGALSIVVNGMNLDVQNDVGDGKGTVYINTHYLFGIRMPFITDLVLTFGSLSNDAPDITVGFRRFDIDRDKEPVMIIKGKHFHIARVRDSHDFLIDVSGKFKVIRRPKSNKVGTVFDDDEYEDIEEN